MNFTEVSSLHITCALGLADLLADELTGHNFPVIKKSKNYVLSTGTLIDAISLNLKLRTAYRVYYELDFFKCRARQELVSQLKTRIDWENVLNPDGYLTVQSFSDNPAINNTMYLNQLVKDAIADYFKVRYNRRPDSGKWNEQALSLFIHWSADEARIYLDTTGRPLDKRGYRTEGLYAPLQETLAAALIMATGWNKKSAFYNPMCGSGTLAIEAALLAAGCFPGLLRDHFSFQNIAGFDHTHLTGIKSALESRPKVHPQKIIYASDFSEKAVAAARHNAVRASVDQWIEFSVAELTDVKLYEGGGIVLVNPPYGQRLGEEESLKSLYKSMGDFFKKRCTGKSCFVFTGSRLLAHQIGLKTSKKMIFYNGDIECRLLKYEMYAGSRKKVS